MDGPKAGPLVALCLSSNAKVYTIGYATRQLGQARTIMIIKVKRCIALTCIMTPISGEEGRRRRIYPSLARGETQTVQRLLAT